ncbi:hypothetical protein LCGC14_2643310 [marine sediment metagenome]|uniref:Uncharacterized protein n=1 Tax=marine sediment metagenome TaxID=412755 RepID=A0A0F9C7P8_9ZZZZ
MGKENKVDEMTDLLTPDEVRYWGYHHVVPDDERTPEEQLLHRFSRDYLELWDTLAALRSGRQQVRGRE